MTDTETTLDFSDYIAAVKRRRVLLAGIGLPILAVAIALAVGLPDIYVSTGLISFSDATVSGKLVVDNDRAAREKPYLDEYVNSLAESVLSGPSLTKLLKERPGIVPADEAPVD